MSNLFFTSDTHFGHKNICRGTSQWEDKSRCRNFDTVEEMNGFIINGINSTVGVDDVLYHLGDFSFGNKEFAKDARDMINCKNIILVKGNHDKKISNSERIFQEVTQRKFFYHNDTVIYMQHHPFADINPYNGYKNGYPGFHIYLHGHTHGYNGVVHNGQIDVSVEGNNYKPYSLDEIIELGRGI